LWDELAELRGHVDTLEKSCRYVEGSGFARDAPAAPCDVESARTLAEAYERLARHAGLRSEPERHLHSAEDLWRLVTLLAPRDSEGFLALERLRVKRGDLDGALVVLEQLTGVDPDNQRSYLERMVSYALSRYRDSDAARYAQRAVDAAPDDPAARERLGDLYRARHDDARALENYSRALALDPTRFALALRVAEIELTKGDTTSAEQRLRSVISASQDDELVMRALHGWLSLSLPDTMFAELERALLPLALATPPRRVYRQALLELYAQWLPQLVAQREPSAHEQLAAIGRRAAKPLLEALADPDLAQSRQAIALLAEVGHASAAPALLAVAQGGSDLELRREAIRVAATLAPNALGPELLALAQTRETRLASVALWAIVRGEPAADSGDVHTHPASDLLRTLARSPVAVLRGYALFGLARRADSEAEHSLEQALTRDPHPFVRGAAALALGMSADRHASDLLVRMSEQTGAPAEAATLALGLIGDEAFAPVLARRLFAVDPRERAAAQIALDALGANERAGIEPPMPLDRLELEPWLAAARASLVARANGDPARHERALRDAALEALRAEDGTKSALLAFLAESSRRPPSAAGGDAREQRLDLPSELLPELATLRAHPDPALRAALVEAIARARSRAAVAALLDLTEDRSARVRGLALSALSERPIAELSASVERLSAAALDEPEFWLRERAVRVLGRSTSEAATRLLVRVLSTDGYALVRESAARSLVGRDASRVGPTLLAALHDSEPRVCAAAARSLRAVGGSSLRSALSDTSLSTGLHALLAR
ncbi:MAG TPA: HEAT repeat domain-containing protein, partial [Polyangiales bacterium]